MSIELGDRVVYDTQFNTLASGIVVEVASGLLGDPMVRVADSWGDRKDEEAGKWMRASDVQAMS